MNKSFLAYLIFILLAGLLITPLFLERYGEFIPNIIRYFNNTKLLSDNDLYITNLGYFGSFLSGSIGLVFAFVTLILLVFTFLEQSRKNEISEVESRIFKLIEVLVEIKNQNELSRKVEIFLEKNNDISDLSLFKNELKKNHLEFSNFFRMLYQILKYINTNEHIISNQYFNKKVNRRVKDYTNIIRSYLDTNLLTCLAINCYCLENEHGEYNKYKELLERYEFLEHLPNVLPIQFSSYIYYDMKAFGNTTWFNSLKEIRSEIIELSDTYKTMDFSELFLQFLCKNNGLWKNENINLKISYVENENTFYMDINNNIDSILDEESSFIIKKYEIINAPYNLEKGELKSKIGKERNKLKITYLKNNSDQKYVDIISIYLTIDNKNTLELETKITNDKPD